MGFSRPNKYTLDVHDFKYRILEPFLTFSHISRSFLSSLFNQLRWKINSYTAWSWKYFFMSTIENYNFIGNIENSELLIKTVFTY